jgi:Acetyltransferase (GNAT) domain
VGVAEPRGADGDSPAEAELIADRGAAAESEEFFRSRPFLDAEGVTHTLRIAFGERTALVPLIVREIEGSDHLDATSPYGYPGATVSGARPAPAPEGVDWSPTGLISVFARERLLADAWVAGASERSPVLVHDPAKPRRLRSRLAEQIRANSRDGWTIDGHPGPQSASADRDAFALAYGETMRRTGAAERYLYPPEYFDSVLSSPRSWLLVARRRGEAGAAAMLGTSDGVLHYYLGGTADRCREASPFKNVVAAMLDRADELQLPLNLGGGVTAGDGLETFKRGFANAELPFRTHELVCDPGEYERLAAGRDAGDFFPAYRAC